MTKATSVYLCSECGYESARWYGKCPGCGAWNTLNEEMIQPEPVSARRSSAASPAAVSAAPLSRISTDSEHRYHTGVRELDRVLGGGIVKGSLVLLGGDPGIGKSTMMLQICEYLGESMRVLYVSGEESQRQIKLRAERLGVTTESLSVMASTDAQSICEFIRADKPDLVIIDSIQTMAISDLSSSPGSVPQVRECTNLFLRTAKASDIPIFIIGHVNKDGAIAGPKVMEHIVDAVLYFEGERNLSYRMLRAVKNRFGSTNEIGMFEMQDGVRPILAEVQGLAATSGFGNPRRMSTGFDTNRFNLILAVLERRCGFYYSNMDTYINVVGGFRLDEPAADLPVALTLVSSLKDTPIDEDLVAFGEIGLAGEVRAVSQAQQRVQEAARLGFTKCILPHACLKGLQKVDGIEIYGVKTLRQAVEIAMK